MYQVHLVATIVQQANIPKKKDGQVNLSARNVLLESTNKFPAVPRVVIVQKARTPTPLDLFRVFHALLVNFPVRKAVVNVKHVLLGIFNLTRSSLTATK